MSNKIKKTYLRFRTTNDGSVNLKFGPQRYVGETEEFFKLLMTGNILSIKFLSSITKEPEARENLFHRVGDTYNAILLDAFPDIEEKILKEEAIIAEVDEAIEEGKQILSDEEEQEFQKKKKELKENLAVEFEEQLPVNEKTKKILKEQLFLQYGITFEELCRSREVILKLQNGDYINKKDKKLLSILSFVGYSELVKKFKLLDVDVNQTYLGELNY